MTQTGDVGALAYVERPDPVPGRGMVLVQIAVAGVNFMDIGVRQGMAWNEMPNPKILGVEGAGRVLAVGEGVDGFDIGQRVAWVYAPGSYAEKIAIPVTSLVPIPDGIADKTAAALMMQGLTASHFATDFYSTQPGDVAFVHAAAGGLGLLLTQIIKLRGGQVIGRVSSTDKVAVAKAAGADHVIVGTDGAFVEKARELTGGEGVHVVFDGSGPSTFPKDTRSSMQNHTRQGDNYVGAPRILIVGGGIAGQTLATRLGDELGRRGKAEITLIDRSPVHIWKPMLHTIAAGTGDVQQQQVSYIAHASEHHFSYQPGSMCGLDRSAREVMLAPLKTLEGEVLVEQRVFRYDVLVLSIGSCANDFGVPGVAEHCHFIDSQAQAEAFNLTLRGRVLRSIVRNETLRVAIVGGGATGVELSAELCNFLDLAAGHGDSTLPERLHLTLLESGPRILAAFPEQISASGAEQLKKLGVELHADTRVTGAEADGFRLGDGSLVPADLMVWAAGVKAENFLADVGGLHVTRSNQVLVKPTLQSLGDPQIFVLGDCASLTLEVGARPLPPTAQVANQQAEHLARHLGAWLAEGSPIPDFAFRDLGSLVSLSQYSAFGTLGKFGFFKGGFVRGRFAQLSHVLVYRRHQVGLLGAFRTGAMWLAERINRCVRPRVRLN